MGHGGVGESEVGIGNAEGGIKKEGEGWKWEWGPAVVPNERDYGAASMPKAE